MWSKIVFSVWLLIIQNALAYYVEVPEVGFKTRMGDKIGKKIRRGGRKSEKQRWIHSIRCFKTPLKEKALGTLRMD